MIATPARDAMAWWLSLPLPTRTQQLLLQMRALASAIETHTPTSQRKPLTPPKSKTATTRTAKKRPRRDAENPYEESWCPLCARIPIQGKTAENTESLTHVLFECQHLHQQQRELEIRAQEWVHQQGGLPLTKDEAPVQWGDLPLPTRLGLLLANPVAPLLYACPEPKVRKLKMADLVLNTSDTIRMILKRRAELIAIHYPELQDGMA